MTIAITPAPQGAVTITLDNDKAKELACLLAFMAAGSFSDASRSWGRIACDIEVAARGGAS